MRWLVFYLAFSAYADCTPQTLYRVPSDYIVDAVVDDRALYVSRLLAGDIQRVDLETGETSVVSVGTPGPWDVQHGYLATPATIGRPADQVKSIKVRDGYVYWVETDGVLRRTLIGGGVVEALAALDIVTPQYIIFEDRVVFINGGRLFWRLLSGGETVPVPLPRSDLGEIGTVTRDAIFVTAYSSPSFYEVRADVFRTSWDGASVETVYQTTVNAYHNSLQVRALAAGATTYIVSYRSGSVRTIVMVLRDGNAAATYDITGPIGVLAATEEAITVAQWGLGLSTPSGTGIHYIVQLCTSQGRRRAVIH
jgi:hypothetical protein